MEENTSLLNKKMSELTVSEDLLLHAMIPIVTITVTAAATIFVGVVKSSVNSFKERKNSETKTEN